jgi:phosphohistidine swiveling domain-containing protein
VVARVGDAAGRAVPQRRPRARRREARRQRHVLGGSSRRRRADADPGGARADRFDVSATISLKEEPDKYKPLAGIADSGEQEKDEQGRTIVGSGDNVFKAPADVTGTARYISDVDRVMEMLTGGVPENTVAIIDDSGGTLTAPILGDFTAVVCMGGTVRSHLGILTREYNVPCLMNAQLDGLADGDEVTVEYAKPAADAYADAEAAAEHRARIIKVA